MSNQKGILPSDSLGIADLSIHAIRRWRLLLVAAIGLTLLASIAWLKIPRLEDPRVENREIFVALVYPGASPEDVETQILRPVEEVLYGMDGVEYVEASALPSRAFFRVKFVDGTAMDVAVERVRGKVQGAKKDLPREVLDPEVINMGTAIMPQMVLIVAGNRDAGVLTEAARRVKDGVTALPGVAVVKLRGERQRALRVRIDPQRLAEHGLSIDQVVQRLKLANIRVPAGELSVGQFITILQVTHELSDAQSLLKAPIGGSADPHGISQIVVLGDVAEVRDEARSPDERFLFDGQPAVALEVRFRVEENAVEVGQRVRTRLADLSRLMPAGVAVRIAHDQPEWIKASVGAFSKSLIEGIALVMLIITLGMGWRAALVVAGVLPLAVGGAILGLSSSGFALEQVSIAGLIVALGLLVDDAVVVTESVQILRDKGLSPLRASVLGTARVFWANNGTTAVACSSFLPLFFMGGPTGDYIKGLPTAVVLALFTSLLVAQLLTPWISTLVLRAAPGVRPISDTTPFNRNHDSAQHDHEERNPALRWLRSLYVRNIPWVVHHPLPVILVSVMALLGACMLLPRIGVLFFPKADKPALFVSVQMPRGTSDEATAQKVTQAIALIRKHREVLDTSAVVGAGYPIVFQGRPAHIPSKDYGDILVRLRPGVRSADMAQTLRRELAAIPGALLNVEELYFGPPVAHPIVIRIYGDDYLKLRSYAEEVRAQLTREPGTLNVTDSLTESVPLSKVELDGDRLLRHGLTPGQVAQTLRALYGEDKVTSFRKDDDQVWIVLEPSAAPADPLGHVERIKVPSAFGQLVPIREAGGVKLGYGFSELKRRNARRIVEISADVDGKALPADIIKRIDPWLRAKTWQPGYGFSYAGAQEETEKSFRNLGMAAAGTMLLIFLLLILMFDSITLPAVILAAVPFALIGALSGLALTGNAFGFMAFLGLIALIGVYVNHKIYFIDRMLELMRRGQNLEQAIVGAGRDRLRPVTLTALTAVLGLVPLTLSGGTLWSAFGWVNIFGLIASIPLSLVLLPALVSALWRIRNRRPRGVTAIAAVLLIALCAAPGTAMAADASSSTPAKVGVGVDGLLARPGGLTAAEVARRAAGTSFEAAARQQEVAAAAAAVDQALVGYFPQLGLAARYARLSPLDAPLIGQIVTAPQAGPGLLPPGTPLVNVPLSFPVLLNQYLLQATLKVPVSDYFTRIHPLHLAGLHGLAAARLNETAARRRAAFDGTVLYYSWVRARLQGVVAERAIAQAQLHLGDVRSALAAGRASKADVLRVESQVASAQLLQERMRNLATLLEDQLHTIMHDSQPGSYEIGEDLAAPASAAHSSTDSAALVGQALGRRPELRALHKQAAALREQSAAAKAGALPKLEVFGELAYTNPTLRSLPLQDEFRMTWAVGAQMSFSPNELMAERAASRGCAARAAQVDATRRALGDAIRSEVIQASLAVREAEVAAATSAQGLAAAEEAYRVRQLLFCNGRATSAELADSETELTRARMDALNAVVDRQIAQARLRFASGADDAVAGRDTATQSADDSQQLTEASR